MLPWAGGGLKSLAEQVGNKLAEYPLENQRARMVEIMGYGTRTVVVLIDDLDRLDRNEIMTMLKLVRLTGNLPHVVYVLAFDDEMVAQAAGSEYGNNRESGRHFLEKIVQFPFAIPAVGQERLVNYVLRHARNATDHSGIILGETDWSAFRDLTHHSLSRRLSTPRQAIRYGSALEFALPILKDEVNPLQQMVVEGLRILFPELYVDIRDNPDFYLSPQAQTSESLPDRIKRETRDRMMSKQEFSLYLSCFKITSGSNTSLILIISTAILLMPSQATTFLTVSSRLYYHFQK
jgi:predicted KAP-like P-loop ATPase